MSEDLVRKLSSFEKPSQSVLGASPRVWGTFWVFCISRVSHGSHFLLKSVSNVGTCFELVLKNSTKRTLPQQNQSLPDCCVSTSDSCPRASPSFSVNLKVYQIAVGLNLVIPSLNTRRTWWGLWLMFPLQTWIPLPPPISGNAEAGLSLERTGWDSTLDSHDLVQTNG